MNHHRHPRTVRRSERGASLVEYALLVALIAVVCIVAVTFVGSSGSSKLTEAGDGVAGTAEPEQPSMTCPSGWHIEQQGVATVCIPN